MSEVDDSERGARRMQRLWLRSPATLATMATALGIEKREPKYFLPRWSRNMNDSMKSTDTRYR